MHPILVRWGSHSLYWYSALLCLGVLLGVAYVQWRGQRCGYAGLLLLDASLWALLAGLLGARLAYVLPNWVDYSGRPLALLSFWGGGLVFQGGLVGGVVGLLLFCLATGASFPLLTDVAAPAISLAQGAGWMGALLHGANYGLVMRSSFSMWLPDLYGIYGPRLPIQLLGALLGLGLFLMLHRLGRRRLLPGVVALLYMLLNGAGHFLLGFGRADEAPYVGLLRVTQAMELSEVVVSSALLLFLWLRYRARRARGVGDGT